MLARNADAAGNHAGDTCGHVQITALCAVADADALQIYALEIARGLPGDAGAGRPLPVPRGLSKLAMERISSLSPAAREAVLVAALLSRPTIAAVSGALSAGILTRLVLVGMPADPARALGHAERAR